MFLLVAFYVTCHVLRDGATRTIRTSDLFLRREALYPAELWPLDLDDGYATRPARLLKGVHPRDQVAVSVANMRKIASTEGESLRSEIVHQWSS